MKNDVLVSVVIPAYNQSSYLTQSVESVLRQTYRNFEIIVIDDGSTDDTSTIVKKLSREVRYVRQENQGLAGARNTGIINARGNLICLLDADDQWLPQYLEKMISLAQIDPGAAVYYCSAQAIDKDGRHLSQVYSCKPLQREQMLPALLRANFLIPSTVMLNYSVIENGECFDKEFRRLQDWEFWIRLLKQGYHFQGSFDVLVNYRIHEESLSVDPEGGQMAAMKLVTKHYGVDDGNPESWGTQKRIAFGGTYRYHTLSSIQRQKNWEMGAYFLAKALVVDPSLAVDLDFFYDLALSEQPSGYKDSNDYENIDHAFKAIKHMLDDVFASDIKHAILHLRSKVYGTANYAMGLVAYNTGHRVLSRMLFFRAIMSMPKFLLVNRITPLLIKSYISPLLLERLKRLVNGGKYAGNTE